MSNVTQEIEQAIAEQGGSVRDALNVALARYRLLRQDVDALRTENKKLREALEVLANAEYLYDAETDCFFLELPDRSVWNLQDVKKSAQEALK